MVLQWAGHIQYVESVFDKTSSCPLEGVLDSVEQALIERGINATSVEWIIAPLKNLLKSRLRKWTVKRKL
jgi:hypothetical protein